MFLFVLIDVIVKIEVFSNLFLIPRGGTVQLTNQTWDNRRDKVGRNHGEEVAVDVLSLDGPFLALVR